MDQKLGRFSLATDGQYIYRLGGISTDISGDGNFGRLFSRYDIRQDSWSSLKYTPFGTGGSRCALQGRHGPLVAIAGKERLGDAFNTNGITLGFYDTVSNKWKSIEIKCPGLGRPDQFVHWKGTQFLMLTATTTLDSGIHVAILDAAKATIDIIGTVPTTNRIVGCTMIKDSLYVLETGRKSTLHMYNPAKRKWANPRSLDGLPSWFFDLFYSYRGKLLLLSQWQADGKKAYQCAHDFKLYQINEKTGCSRELHQQFSNPQARRSCSGICVGNVFYLLGGERPNGVWLPDTMRYHLSLRDPYYK